MCMFFLQTLVSAPMLLARLRASSLGRFVALALCGSALTLFAGCGKGTHGAARSVGEPSSPPNAQGVLGVSTKNTTRLGGATPAEDAAAVAQVVYPGFTPATRPQAVVLADEGDWPASLAASVLASAPLGAPLLYGDADSLPAQSEHALSAMHPFGASTLGGAQVLEVGRASAPAGYRVKSIPGSGPTSSAGGEAAASAAVQVLRLLELASGRTPQAVIAIAADTPRALQMPAAALAAESGAPLMFVTSTGVPRATSEELRRLKRPLIYVIAPKTLRSGAYAALARLGTVVHVTGETSPGEGTAHASNDPVENAISISRFSHGSFGWGIHEAGHGLVFANVARPLDAPAAASLSSHGDYGPLLLLEHSASVPTALTQYLSNIEPGYTATIPPVREVYNHGWLIGDESAISALAQAELDAVLEIAPRQPTDAEESVAEAE
jgi:hypothetical protein